MTFLLCFLTSPTSLIQERIWHADPNKMVILRHWSAFFLVSQLSKCWSCIPCLNTLSLRFLFHNRMSLDLVTLPVQIIKTGLVYFYSGYTILNWSELTNDKDTNKKEYQITLSLFHWTGNKSPTSLWPRSWMVASLNPKFHCRCHQ